MEIERKYLVAKLPDQLETYPCLLLEQGYLNTNPVVRIRRDKKSTNSLTRSCRTDVPSGI